VARDAVAIEKGLVASAQQHFEENAYMEGRLSFAL